MRRRNPVLFGAVLAALLAGMAGATASAAMAQPLAPPVALAPPAFEPDLPASDLLVRYQGPTLRFRWALAPEAALEPALVGLLRADALADREKMLREAQQGNEAAGRTIQYEWDERWTEDAETDLLLAFSAEEYSYTGGAHGNLVLKGVIFDRTNARIIPFAELFADETAMWAALKPAFCKALDDERRERRDGQLGDNFTECPEPGSFPIVPVGDGKVQALRVLVPPYEAGPWVEGAYEILLDSDIVRPFLQEKYRNIFTDS